MTYRLPLLIAGLLATTSSFAQPPAEPPVQEPVQETQAPENQVINPEQRTVPLPPTAANAPASTPAKPEKWDVSAPRGLTTRQVPINVDEGSWMNVDVSPDGRMIAFDLLGAI